MRSRLVNRSLCARMSNLLDGQSLRRLAFFSRVRLQAVQIGDGALRVGCRLKDCTLVVTQYLQPRIEVTCMIRTWLKFWRDPKIGAQEATTKLGNIS